MTGEERKKLSPALFFAAAAVCAVSDVGGCSPERHARCQCWAKAEAAMRATDLSAQGVAWVFSNLRWIENEAAREASQ
jgi:hypothetical protein